MCTATDHDPQAIRPLKTARAQDTDPHSYLCRHGSGATVLNSCCLVAGESPLWSTLDVGGRQRRVDTVTHLIVKIWLPSGWLRCWVSSGKSAANVPTKSGDAETAVSSSHGNTRQPWRSTNCQDDVRFPCLPEESVRQNERFQRRLEDLAGLAVQVPC